MNQNIEHFQVGLIHKIHDRLPGAANETVGPQE
jgi:hypothetical protein